MPMLDLFNNDAFSLTSLTDRFNLIPHRPMRIGELGIFDERGIATTTLAVEALQGQLSLIGTSPRGASGDVYSALPRTVRTFRLYHFVRTATIMADEVQNVRAFGSESELQTVEDLVTQRLEELRPAHEVTLEYHRANAIQGQLLDADGSTLLNLFTEFGTTQQTHNFAFSSGTTDVRNEVIAAVRKAEDELGGIVVSRWIGLCSREWFDAFVGHASVKESVKYQESRAMREDLRSGFRYGGVDWEEYRGSVAKPGGGVAQFIPANTAWLVPVTSPSIFVTRFGPADYEETVNTLGRPLYAKQVPDPSGLNKYRLIETQSNAISLCLRPRAVVKLTRS